MPKKKKPIDELLEDKPPEEYENPPEPITAHKRACREEMVDVSILGSPGYETYIKEGDYNVYVRPLWRDAKSDPPEMDQKVLAIMKTQKGRIYNLMSNGWAMDTIYACRYTRHGFIITSERYDLNPTHWMPQPELPEG